jgi:hypothetical protein
MATMVTVAACSNTKGQPSPASSTAESSSSSANSVPPVTQPILDLTKYQNNPCGILRADQLASLGITKPGRSKDSAVGPACGWKPDDTDGTVIDVSLLTKINGLQSIYQNRDHFQTFRPTQVAGYPAVDADALSGNQGDCGTSVGTANDSGFDVAVQIRSQSSAEYSNPCSVSKKIAQIIIGNLKGGG